MIASVFLLGLLAFSTAGVPTDRDSERAQQLADAANSFGVDILKALPERQNAFISPLSIVTALGMLYAGARGNTARELRTALNFEKANLDDNNVHPAFREILDRLTTPSEEYTLDVANKALTRSNLHILDEYRNTLENSYQAELEEVDFQNDGELIKNQVNQWVREQTREKINSLLDDQLDPSTALLLLNAVYFKGTWKTQFDKQDTRPATFFNNGGDFTTTMVPSMHLEMDARYGYSDELESKLLELPYVGDDLSMVFILPRKKNGLSYVERKLTNENLQNAIENLEETPEVQIRIPKFKLEKEYQLKDVLQAVGITEAFSNNADLSGITDEAGLQVTEVIHKAAVEVNEEGSEAAAVSGVEIQLRFGHITTNYFLIDRPFAFAIRDRRTGLLLFLGRVYKF